MQNGRWIQQLFDEGAAGRHNRPLRPQWLRVLVFLFWALLVPPFCELDLLETQMQFEVWAHSLRWAHCCQVELVHSELARSLQTVVLMVWTYCFWFWLVNFPESVQKVPKGSLCYRKDVLD